MSAVSRAAFQRSDARCQCLKVRAEIAKDEGVLLAELKVRFVVNAVAGNRLSAGSQTLKQHCNLLDKQQTDSDIGRIARIGEAWKPELMACCAHGISDDLVLKLNWKIFEGEHVIDLVGFINKYSRNEEIAVLL